MEVIKLRNGSVVKEVGKITYFSFSSPSDSSVLPMDLSVLEAVDLLEDEAGRKYYEGYKANITKDDLRDWGQARSGDKEDIPTMVSKLKDALNGEGKNEVKLVTSLDEQPTLEFHTVIGRQKFPLGVIKLEKIEIVASAGRVIETAMLNLIETSEENREVRAESASIRKKQAELEASIRSLTKAKARMEDRLVRACNRLVNTKKEKIMKLEKKLAILQRNQNICNKPSSDKSKAGANKSKNNNITNAKPTVIVSSSDSEAEKISNQDTTTDYDEETDVQDSDEAEKTQAPHSSKSIPVKRKSSEPKPASPSVSETTPSANKTEEVRKNLFPRQVMEKTPNSRPRRMNAKYTKMDDSQTDSSQEFICAPSRTRRTRPIPSFTKPNATPAVEPVEEATPASPEPELPPILMESSEDEKPEPKKSRSDDDQKSNTQKSDNDSLFEKLFLFDSQ